MQYMLLIYGSDDEWASLAEDEAAAAYRRALELATNPVERRFLERRLRKVA